MIPEGPQGITPGRNIMLKRAFEGLSGCFGGGHAGHLCRSRTDGHQCPAAHTSISILIVSRPRAET